MYLNGELEYEYREMEPIEEWNFQKNSDREKRLQEVIPTTRYTHKPSDGCSKRGLTIILTL